jgi:mannose-6-phosphate isomerase-like protein (cupin superfamily)
MSTSETKLAGWHLASDEGDSIWFLGSFMRFKATAETTGGAFTLIDEIAGPGRQSPPHIHHSEDEAFWIIEGEVTFTCGDKTYVAEPGSFVFLPRNIQHNFRVTSEVPARMLLWISPAGLEGFFKEMGEPGRLDQAPPPSVPDIPKLLAVAAKYHAEHPTLTAQSHE